MLLFVYDTLQKSFPHHILISKAKFVGKGYIYGELYDLGVDFPAVTIESLSYRQRVFGEVYDVLENLIDDIDEFEGYYPDKEENSIYLRKEVQVHLSKSQIIKADAYLMREEKLKLFFAFPIKKENWS